MKGIVDFWLLNQRNLELRYDASDFKIEQDTCYQGQVKGGVSLWASARGPALSGGPAHRFFGPRGCLCPHVFWDRTAQFWADMIYVAGRWGTAF